MSRLTPYLAICRARFFTLIQYRTAAFAGICTQWLFGLVRIMVLEAFYAYGGAEQPMSFAQVVSYTWVGQAMLGMLPWNIERELGQSVRTGQVAYELTRPVDLYAMWYARCLAQRVGPTLLKSVPMFAIALFLMPEPYRMALPTGVQLGAWAAATLGALLLSCAVTSLLNISLFWTVSGEGIVRILPTLVTLFSGMTVPIPLFPDWMQTFLKLQPFSGLVDVPARLLCGSLPPSELLQLLALQLFWIAILVLLGRWLMKRGLRRVIIAGG